LLIYLDENNKCQSIDDKRVKRDTKEYLWKTLQNESKNFTKTMGTFMCILLGKFGKYFCTLRILDGIMGDSCICWIKYE
jgi:hypothetical protein